nr:UBP1-associated proteins 1C-like isoform X4 [Ipomoea batatas]
MGLLQFGLICIDFLAWPMIALAYPLCASIRAIETGSKHHMRKLVTYWTVFSIVSLFEHTLRVIEWVPLWPYIKLVGTFWLVVPRFNGACYAYDCLVNADLGAKLHCILSQISHALFADKHLSIDVKAMEQTTEQETEETKSKDFKSMEQTTEHGTEGTKSLDIRPVEQTTEQGSPEERKVKSAVDNIGEMQIQETEPPFVKAIPGANAAEEKIIPEINSSKLIQREWTCAVCQVTTNSEHDLKCHLRGMRHKTNCAELKPIKWATEHPGSKQAASVSADPKLYCRICNIWCSREIDMASHLKGRKHLSNLKQTGVMVAEKATGRHYQVKNEPARPNSPANGGSKQKTNGNEEKAPDQKGNRANGNNASVIKDYNLYCSLCNIWAPCKAAMVAHLKGKKHLSNLK